MSPRLHTPVSFDYDLPAFMLAVTVISAVFTSLILGICLWAAWTPVSRPHLNRVSFRLLMYALVANLGYTLCASYTNKLTSGAACSGTACFANTCILFAAIMFFCMALNLHLVLVHGVNGQSMEKYYVSGAVVMQYSVIRCRYNEVTHWCWFRSSEVAERLRWWMFSIGLWPFLLSAGKLLAFFTIVGSMDWRLSILLKLLYTLRPMAYTLLAATDPSLLRALRALRGSNKASPKPISVSGRSESSITRSTARPLTNCDTEAEPNSTTTEENSDESEERFTRQI
ncbi:hypothetical protein B0H16DRAFT_1769745 [Mycena metata]|uniref:Uncharacterized protein n=1 Tax=Mycena metata TaxID=1033252 RepID=A0AAD7MW04_9AGAR|nr:hypothetical protein B0H16DRAFT_1769745 [Mycena metata]